MVDLLEWSGVVKVLLTQVNDELHDLEDGDPFLPPDADAAGALKVVPVHHDMDQEVQGDGHPGDCCVADQLCVAEEGCSAMVVGMEEGERLLLEDEEDRVEELEVFRQVVQLEQVLARKLSRSIEEIYKHEI